MLRAARLEQLALDLQIPVSRCDSSDFQDYSPMDWYQEPRESYKAFRASCSVGVESIQADCQLTLMIEAHIQ